MKLFKKTLTLTALSLATAGVLTFGQDLQVSAESSWQARTAEEVKEEVKENKDGSKSYTVQKGDTLAIIAKALDVDLNVLVSANNISNPDLILVGTEITISKDQKTVTTQSPSGQKISQPTYKATGKKQVSQGSSYHYQAAAAKSSHSAQNQSTASYSSNATSGGEAAAKEWIAQRESNGSYTAYNPNGGYYGRYQLNPSLVKYGASAAEQEAAADKYVSGRYGSWTNAKAHWQQKGWY